MRRGQGRRDAEGLAVEMPPHWIQRAAAHYQTLPYTTHRHVSKNTGTTEQLNPKLAHQTGSVSRLQTLCESYDELRIISGLHKKGYGLIVDIQTTMTSGVGMGVCMYCIKVSLLNTNTCMVY